MGKGNDEQNVELWLAELALERYAPVFAEAEIEPSDLAYLTEEDLKELGLPLGPRRRVSEAIRQLTGETGENAPTSLSQSTINREADTLSTTSASPADAERRHLTVMFVDLVGSTEMATRIDAEDMRNVITSYQNTVAGVVGRYEGFVAKFMGDGVLCYFGWPRANEDDAERAVRAGLSIIDSVMKTKALEGAPLATRVGIATGVVIVGDLIGSGATQEAAVVGETPNLAARLQGIAGLNQLVIPRETQRLLGNAFTLKSIGGQTLKGIGEQVEAYVVEGETAVESRFAARQSGTLTPIVGREREISLMVERWALARSGQGQMLIVSGEAGIGKSRITRAVVDQIAHDDHVRMTYQCSPYNADSAFYPVIQQMSFAARIMPADSPVARLDKLEALLGTDRDTLKLVAPLMGLDGTARYGALDLTPAQQRAQTMQALARLLVRQAAESPLLFIYEDLHWIDPTSLELLDVLLDAIADQKIMILATARPTFDYGFGGHPIVTRFALNRLGKEQIAAIVAKLTGGKALPEEVLQIIARRTDGVPLFVEELTKTILESGALTEDGDRFLLNGPLSSIAIPTTLHDSLMARLDRLQPIKEVAQTAACIGREFGHGLLAQISLLPDAELAAALDGLIGAELIYRRGLPPEATYLFKHALVRDAAYESLLKERRRDVHTGILTALEKEADIAPEVLATHAEAAGLADRAIEYLHKAGEHSLRLSANAEAIVHLSKALELVRAMSSGRERDQRELSLLMTMGPAIIAAKGYAAPEVARAYHRALELCENLGDTERQFSVLLGLTLFHYVRADLPLLRRLADQLMELAKIQTESGCDLAAERMLGYVLANLGELETARTKFDHVVASYDYAMHGTFAARRGGSDFGVGSLIYGGWVMSMLGYLDQARDRYATALQLARQLEHPISEAFAHWAAACIHLVRHEPKTALKCIQFAADIAEEKEFPQYRVWTMLVRGVAHFQLGAYPEAIAEIQKGLDASKVIGSVVINPFWMAYLASALGRNGQVQEGLVTIADTFELLERTDERMVEAELHRVKGELLLQSDVSNEPKAESCFLKAIEIARSQNAKTWELRAAVSLARLWCDQSKSENAREFLEPIYGWFTEGLETADLKDAHTLLCDLS